jgi:solute carrier family 10 (sodium/bile acid cotransporter), member 7
MRAFLLRRWFLLFVTVGVGLALARPGWLRPFTQRLPLRPAVALSLFLTAWGLEARRLWGALARPAAAFWALAVSYGALPGLAWGLGHLLPSADLSLGLFLMSTVPCTLVTAVLWTRLAGGNEALTLLVVVLSTSLSWLVTTAWLTWVTGVRAAVDPAGMMGSLALVLVVPVGLAQLSRALPGVPGWVARRRGLLGVVARLLIGGIILKAVVDVSGRLGGLTAGRLLSTAGACLGAHGAAFALGLWGGRALRFPPADCIAAALSGSQKTLPVALFLFGAYYERDYPLAVVPVVLYHVGQLVVDTFLAEGLAGRSPAGEKQGHRPCRPEPTPGPS